MNFILNSESIGIISPYCIGEPISMYIYEKYKNKNNNNLKNPIKKLLLQKNENYNFIKESFLPAFDDDYIINLFDETIIKREKINTINGDEPIEIIL
jgi:hypothetical protein